MRITLTKTYWRRDAAKYAKKGKRVVTAALQKVSSATRGRVVLAMDEH